MSTWAKVGFSVFIKLTVVHLVPHIIADHLIATEPKRRVALSVTSFLVLPEILRQSDLIAVVPSRLVAHADGLAQIPPPLDIPGFTKVMAWHERTHHDAAHRWVREALFKASAGQ